MGLYTKQSDGVQPEKSMIGCLVATAGMVGVIAIIALWQGAGFIFGQAESARGAQAERAILRIEAAARELLEDTEAPSLESLFAPGAFDDLDPEAESRWLLQVLRRGKTAPMPLQEAFREKMKDQYIDFTADPWQEPWRLSRPGPEDDRAVVATHSRATP